MNRATETAHYAWHSLRQTLEETCEYWNDVTTEYFLSYYWQPLEAETERFQSALQRLNAVLEAALSAVY